MLEKYLLIYPLRIAKGFGHCLHGDFVSIRHLWTNLLQWNPYLLKFVKHWLLFHALWNARQIEIDLQLSRKSDSLIHQAHWGNSKRSFWSFINSHYTSDLHLRLLLKILFGLVVGRFLLQTLPPISIPLMGKLSKPEVDHSSSHFSIVTCQDNKDSVLFWV